MWVFSMLCENTTLPAHSRSISPECLRFSHSYRLPLKIFVNLDQIEQETAQFDHWLSDNTALYKTF